MNRYQKCVFEFNLRRYSMAVEKSLRHLRNAVDELAGVIQVKRCMLNSIEARLECASFQALKLTSYNPRS
jgi:hypothetical protein